ncbi:MAG: glutathione transferase GstA [Pseudomonadota bacterium]|nr:glutathione transferase GstA [Pseudomonadota bacterium]
MKLYYKPGACSLASHIALREAGVNFDLEKVDTKQGRTESGEDFSKVNPNGYVPALKLDTGEVITEGAAVLQYIAEENPKSGLVPFTGTALQRAKVREFLNYVASELHIAYGPFFGARLDAEAHKQQQTKLSRKLDYIEKVLSDGRDYLVGSGFTVADAYLYAVAGWTKFTGLDLARWPNLAAYVKRISSRRAVRDSLEAEGLLVAA